MPTVRTQHHLRHDPTRLILRPLVPGAANFAGEDDRADRLIARVLALPDDEIAEMLSELESRHAPRFSGLEERWLSNLRLARAISHGPDPSLSHDQRMLLGATFSQAYAYEGAALTNPSIVPVGSPDHDAQRFVMSARAIGEGHISSIAFLTGVVDGAGAITLDERSPRVSNGTRSSAVYSRLAFAEKLSELGIMTEAAQKAVDFVPESFTSEDLRDALQKVSESDIDQLSSEDAAKHMTWLAASNYEVSFDSALPVSEHVISPAGPLEIGGMEDARFVRFVEDDGRITYFATYTAFDGYRILPQLIETSDFHRFRIATSTGPAMHHKGMAIFPRRIRGEFVALSRHDHESTYVLRSDHIRSWDNAEFVYGPERGWDIIQTGNCGSPIETDEGWLVITHGVGPMRRYVLSALLLDLDEPSKVLGRLRRPLLEPINREVYGYVPDVVYSCGSMIHRGNLITPFGYSDVGIKFAVTPLDEILSEMA